MKKFTDFEKALLDVCIGWIGEEPGFESYIHECAKKLQQLVVITDSPFFWVARDYNGSLFLYNSKPELEANMMYFFPVGSDCTSFYSIDDRLLPEVTFENSPQQVKFILYSN